MKKLLQKRKNNKGFSLVELIVVVAIMAVLIGVLVPTLVRNVEKSKKQKDVSAVEEIRNQMQVALADEDYSDLSGTLVYKNGTINITSADSSSTITNAGYLKEVCQNLNASDTFSKTLSSKAYKTAGVTFTISNEKVTAVIIPAEGESIAVGD